MTIIELQLKSHGAVFWGYILFLTNSVSAFVSSLQFVSILCVQCLKCETLPSHGREILKTAKVAIVHLSVVRQMNVRASNQAAHIFLKCPVLNAKDFYFLALHCWKLEEGEEFPVPGLQDCKLELCPEGSFKSFCQTKPERGSALG